MSKLSSSHAYSCQRVWHKQGSSTVPLSTGCLSDNHSPAALLLGWVFWGGWWLTMAMKGCIWGLSLSCFAWKPACWKPLGKLAFKNSFIVSVIFLLPSKCVAKPCSVTPQKCIFLYESFFECTSIPLLHLQWETMKITLYRDTRCDAEAGHTLQQRDGG